MKNKFIVAYMKVAKTFAEMSYAKRAKVGAIIVKDDRIISIGYNGMPPVGIMTVSCKFCPAGRAA